MWEAAVFSESPLKPDLPKAIWDEPMQPRWKDVSEAINEFRRHLSADFPSFVVQHLYDFAWTPEQYKSSRKTSAYNACGVYLVYDADGKLLYVGKASWTFDKRGW